MAEAAAVIQGGPWGGSGGDPWIFTTNGGRIYSIKIITGTGNANCIASLEFFYTDKDNIQHSSKRFGTTGSEVETVNFADDEDIVEIKGTFGAYYHMTVITSLTFVTNKKVYGPFGRLTGAVMFSNFEAKGKFEGFFGRSGDVIDSLGAVLFPK